MNNDINNLYESALLHREIHKCGAVPYQDGKFLIDFVKSRNIKRILEIGTGVGYSTICLATGNNEARIETIDKDAIHISIARENSEKFGIKDRLTFYSSKAEDIFPKLNGNYDLIFYDGHTPQKKFVKEFERLLKNGGTLISTNLFLSHKSGGGYLKLIKSNNWDTKIEDDTAISIRQ